MYKVKNIPLYQSICNGFKIDNQILLLPSFTVMEYEQKENFDDFLIEFSGKLKFLKQEKRKVSINGIMYTSMEIKIYFNYPWIISVQSKHVFKFVKINNPNVRYEIVIKEGKSLFFFSHRY